MARFEPKGDRPEWRMIYDELLAEAGSGHVVPYVSLDNCLGRDFRSNRSPIYRARAELGDVRRRWLEAVPSVGYRVTEPRDHARLSRGHRSRSRRQLGLAVRVLDVTDLAQLDATGLAEWDTQQRVTFALWAIVAHENRLRAIENVLRREGLM